MRLEGWMKDAQENYWWAFLNIWKLSSLDLTSLVVFFQHSLDFYMCICFMCVGVKEISHWFEMHELIRADMMNPEWTFSLTTVVSGLLEQNFKK